AVCGVPTLRRRPPRLRRRVDRRPPPAFDVPVNPALTRTANAVGERDAGTLRTMIRVGGFGAGGRMRATVGDAVGGADDMELVAAVDPQRAGAAVEGTDLTISADPAA